MKDIKNREDVPRMYLEDKLSTVQIGKLIGLRPGAVASILKSRGVKLRTPKEGFKTRFPDGRFGSLAARWSGGTRTTKSGYIMVYMPNHPGSTKDGYVMEHRLILEKKLGRYLARNEIAHHINGIKNDNRPDNIMLEIKGQHTKNHFRDSFRTKDLEQELLRLRAIIRDCEKCTNKLHITA